MSTGFQRTAQTAHVSLKTKYFTNKHLENLIKKHLLGVSLQDRLHSMQMAFPAWVVDISDIWSH